MLYLDVRQNYFAMTEFFDSYYWASKDDSLGGILGSMIMWRNDDDTLFDKAISDDWNKFYYSVSSKDHSFLEGFEAVKQFANEYLLDSEDYTELSRNLTYAIRKICDMSADERSVHPIWQNWIAACKWICNPNVVKVKESPFVDSMKDEKVSRENQFPMAKVLPVARPIVDDESDSNQISEIQNYYIMLDFLGYYDEITPDNQDLNRILSEFVLERKTQAQEDHWYSWNAYFVDVSKKSEVVNLIQSLAVVSQFMQVWVPDNALHTDFGRKLTRDIWNTIYMSAEDRNQTEIWKNWMVSADKVLND